MDSLLMNNLLKDYAVVLQFLFSLALLYRLMLTFYDFRVTLGLVAREAEMDRRDPW